MGSSPSPKMLKMSMQTSLASYRSWNRSRFGSRAGRAQEDLEESDSRAIRPSATSRFARPIPSKFVTRPWRMRTRKREPEDPIRLAIREAGLSLIHGNGDCRYPGKDGLFIAVMPALRLVIRPNPVSIENAIGMPTIVAGLTRFNSFDDIQLNFDIGFDGDRMIGGSAANECRLLRPFAETTMLADPVLSETDVGLLVHAKKRSVTTFEVDLSSAATASSLSPSGSMAPPPSENFSSSTMR